MNWRCIYCKPRCSEKVKFYLENANIEVLYPIIKEKRTINNKIVYKYSELFPNYIFAKFHDKDYRLVKYTRGVSRILSNRNNEPIKVPEKLIETIKSQMNNGYVELKKKFNKGDRVVITDGPFKEMEAVFLEHIKPKERVLILLKTLNREVKVEIDTAIILKKS